MYTLDRDRRKNTLWVRVAVNIIPFKIWNMIIIKMLVVGFKVCSGFSITPSYHKLQTSSPNSINWKVYIDFFTSYSWDDQDLSHHTITCPLCCILLKTINSFISYSQKFSFDFTYFLHRCISFNYKLKFQHVTIAFLQSIFIYTEER